MAKQVKRAQFQLERPLSRNTALAITIAMGSVWMLVFAYLSSCRVEAPRVSEQKGEASIVFPDSYPDSGKEVVLLHKEEYMILIDMIHERREIIRTPDEPLDEGGAELTRLLCERLAE